MIVMQLPVQQEMAPVGLDEVALVRAAQSDLSAFTELYRRYARQVYRYLLVRVGDEADAQDITSQTFLAAMQGLGSYRGQQPFAAWLFGIARNKAADHFRKRRPVADLEAAEEVQDDADLPDELIGRRLDLDRVSQILNLIAPDRAEALYLRFFAGLEVSEIARIMNKNEAAVRMSVFRGLRDMQDRLSGQREVGQ